MLTQASCSIIQVPNLPELSLKRQWPIFNAAIPNFRSFMPENWYENPEKRVDRVFMWRIASYLDKHYVCMVIEEVRSLRAARKAQKIVVRADIQVANEWAEQLFKGEFQPSKCPLTKKLVRFADAYV